jgi:hypothetical protein
MYEFGSDYGEQKTRCGFYQTTRMSFTDLELAAETTKKGISVDEIAQNRRNAGRHKWSNPLVRDTDSLTGSGFDMLDDYRRLARG